MLLLPGSDEEQVMSLQWPCKQNPICSLSRHVAINITANQLGVLSIIVRISSMKRK